LCLVPTIWLLELDELEKRIVRKEREENITTPTPMVTLTYCPVNYNSVKFDVF